MALQARTARATVTTLAPPKEPLSVPEEAMLTFDFDQAKPKGLISDAVSEEPSTIKEAIIHWLNERM